MAELGSPPLEVKAQVAAGSVAPIVTPSDFASRARGINRMQQSARLFTTRWVKDGDFTTSYYIIGALGKPPELKNELINREWFETAQRSIDESFENLIKDYDDLYGHYKKMENTLVESKRVLDSGFITDSNKLSDIRTKVNQALGQTPTKQEPTITIGTWPAGTIVGTSLS